MIMISHNDMYPKHPKWGNWKHHQKENRLEVNRGPLKLRTKTLHFKPRLLLNIGPSGIVVYQSPVVSSLGQVGIKSRAYRSAVSVEITFVLKTHHFSESAEFSL